MAEAILVDLQLKEGQRLLDRLVEESVPVTAAAWVKESESGDWYLYLVTPLVSESGGKKAAYHQVNEVMRKMQDEGFSMDPFAKKVIGPNDPIAKDLLAYRKGRPGGPPLPFRGVRLGDLPIQRAYIYPRSPTPEEAAGLQLWDRGEIVLRPGVGSAGLSRVVVIDKERQTMVQDHRYRGTMRNPKPLSDTQLDLK
jgi:hypothetical protein